MANIIEIDSGNEDAIKFLEPFFQSGKLNFLIGSGASYPAIKIAGTIEAEINDLIASGKNVEANTKCFEFISAISAAHVALTDGANDTTKKVLEQYVRFISAIDQTLFARKNNLLPRQATIFTTNYDMFLEYAANNVSTVVLNDGFDRTARIGNEFTFAPERFFDRTYRSSSFSDHKIEIPTLNLVKLHGSITWKRRGDQIILAHETIDNNTINMDDPIAVSSALESYFVTLPNIQKFHSTLIERVYYDLLRLYSNVMDQQNCVLFSFGFSFNDEHILDITRRSLRNPTSHLIIFSHEKSSAPAYEAKFSKQRNVTILSPGNGEKIDFQRYNNILGSILPENP